MKKDKRHQIILNEVHIHNRVLLSDLATILNVSMDTVRRDIKELDSKKSLKKVHGGAVSNGFNINTDKTSEIYDLHNKTIIAKKGITLLKEGDVILISGGSTNIELIKLLPRKMGLTFFTPSLQMAVELLNNTSNKYDVYLIGGKLSRSSQLATGGSTINILSEIKADICFLGTGYLDIEHGITEVDWEIAQMKKAMIKASKQVVSLAISEKINTFNRYKIGDLSAIDILVTELNTEDPILNKYQKENITLL
ncbi:DeoR/GlpR family DNA-binding transcription regulator [Maribacter sp.]|uniref:DeoR/GlpR family DNA-binding transcription regulator n=1 Tax=Maribacter sp. TaxID=1897614 RepID=UPI0025C0026A|nr:DeoR/GlpR family DNA-binding transcription regulator [Maribacter sp.]